MSKSTVAFLFGIVMMLGAVGLFIFGVTQHLVESRLASHGTHVLGRVLYRQVVERGQSSATHNDGTSQSDFYLKVDYPVDNATEHGMFECTMLAYDTHPEGSSVEVVYDPNDHSIVRLGGNLNANSSGWTYYTSAAIFILGLMIALYMKLNRKEVDGDLDDDPPTDCDPPPAGHWTNDPLHEQDPGNIPTR